jgi:hypothetical protein
MAGKTCGKCESEMTIVDGYWVCVNRHREKVTKQEQTPDWVDDDMLHPKNEE